MASERKSLICDNDGKFAPDDIQPVSLKQLQADPYFKAFFEERIVPVWVEKNGRDTGSLSDSFIRHADVSSISRGKNKKKPARWLSGLTTKQWIDELLLGGLSAKRDARRKETRQQKLLAQHGSAKLSSDPRPSPTAPTANAKAIDQPPSRFVPEGRVTFEESRDQKAGQKDDWSVEYHLSSIECNRIRERGRAHFGNDEPALCEAAALIHKRQGLRASDLKAIASGHYEDVPDSTGSHDNTFENQMSPMSPEAVGARCAYLAVTAPWLVLTQCVENALRAVTAFGLETATMFVMVRDEIAASSSIGDNPMDSRHEVAFWLRVYCWKPTEALRHAKFPSEVIGNRAEQLRLNLWVDRIRKAAERNPRSARDLAKYMPPQKQTETGNDPA